MDSTRRRFLAALGAAATGAVAGCGAPSNEDGSPTAATATAEETTSEPTATPDDARFARVYREVVPSVVRVRVYGPDGPFSQGTGWVFDADGHLVTNQHVVDGGETVRVQFREGEWREAELVGADVYSDLAVLAPEDPPAYAEALSLVESEPPVGTEVLAIGSPFGLGGSASAGIISGVDRSLPSVNDFTIADGVQTDAALNPGNSGGPLVTLSGDVVGVVTQARGDNVGFAISAALLSRVVPSLIESGDYDHPFMGVRIRPVTPLLAEANDLAEPRGVYVDQVMPDGPSDGVLQGSEGSETVEGVSLPVGGDTVVGLDDATVDTLADLSTFLALETAPGDTVAVTVVRDGERETVDLTLGTRPDPGI